MATTPHPTQIGKYEILSVLGRGGMGIVYKARDTVLDRVVAIKTISVSSAVLEENQVERLQMEARSAGRLHHPNIVTVYDYGSEGDLSYIVMEYAEGIDLGNVIAIKQPLALPAKIDMLLQICHGLDFAHESGVTHRDMKPSNVRLTNTGVAKILDFGLARFDNTQLTKTGFISGTIAYMSPERLSGEAGKSDDIFALGAVAYELLTYERAFPGATPPEVMMKIMGGAPPAPSTIAEVPAVLDAPVLRCLSRNAADRFHSANDFANAIEEAFESDEAQAFVTHPSRSTLFREALSRWTPPKRRRETRARTMSHTDHVAVAGTTDEPTMTQPYTPPAPIATPNDPTVISHGLAQEPTVVVSTGARPKSNRKTLLAAAVVGIAILGLAAWATLRNGSDDRIATTATTTTTTAAPTTAAANADSGRVQKAYFELNQLSQQIQAKLSVAQSDGITIAQPRLAELSERLRKLQGHAEAGATEVIEAEGQKLLEDYDAEIRRGAASRGQTVPERGDRKTREQLLAAAQPKSDPARPIAATPAATPPPTAPAPVVTAAPPPVVTTRPTPPAPTPTPTPAPAPDYRAEVTGFMRRVASAYSNRDADFFRDNALNYSDAMARGVKNSPSTRVEIQIEGISIDGNRAAVTALRTDEFGGNAPAAKQRLVYHLERGDGGWKIARFERR